MSIVKENFITHEIKKTCTNLITFNFDCDIWNQHKNEFKWVQTSLVLVKRWLRKTFVNFNLQISRYVDVVIGLNQCAKYCKVKGEIGRKVGRLLTPWRVIKINKMLHCERLSRSKSYDSYRTVSSKVSNKAFRITCWEIGLIRDVFRSFCEMCVCCFYTLAT